MVEGQAGTDAMAFNGSGGNEIFTASANGGRVLFTRNLGSIVMDLDDLEVVDLNALGGADTATVNDLSGTDVVQIDTDLAGTLGGVAGDAQPDVIIVKGTNGDDIVDVVGSGTSAAVIGLHTQVNIANSRRQRRSRRQRIGRRRRRDRDHPALRCHQADRGRRGRRHAVRLAGRRHVPRGRRQRVHLRGQRQRRRLHGRRRRRVPVGPGDGNDTVEGQDGTDSMLFFGANIAENFDIAPNGGRVLFFRNIASVTMDLDDVESVDVRALGGADNFVVGDLSATDLTTIDADLRGPNGGGDGAADTITVNGTQGADGSVPPETPVGSTSSGCTPWSTPTPRSRRSTGSLNAGGDDVVDSAALQPTASSSR